MFFVWWLIFDFHPFTSKAAGHSAFYRTIALLVVASPCALCSPSPPPSCRLGARHDSTCFAVAQRWRNSVQHRHRGSRQNRRASHQELKVEKVESFPPWPGKRSRSIGLFTFKKIETHPLARAITRYGKQNQISSIVLENFESLTGQGLKAKYLGQVGPGKTGLARRNVLNATSLPMSRPERGGF